MIHLLYQTLICWLFLVKSSGKTLLCHYIFIVINSNIAAHWTSSVFLITLLSSLPRILKPSFLSSELWLLLICPHSQQIALSHTLHRNLKKKNKQNSLKFLELNISLSIIYNHLLIFTNFIMIYSCLLLWKRCWYLPFASHSLMLMLTHILFILPIYLKLFLQWFYKPLESGSSFQKQCLKGIQGLIENSHHYAFQ